MKQFVLLVAAIAVLGTAPIGVSAANVKATLHKSQTTSYEGIKLPEGVRMYQNNPKALFADGAKKGIKDVLTDAGAVSVNVYTVNIKNENEINYAIYGDVIFGKQVFVRISDIKDKSTASTDLGTLASSINTGTTPILGDVTVVTPLTKQGNTYQGILKYKSIINNNSYNEIIHITLFDDKYMGPSARFIAVDEESDATVFPKVKSLLSGKK